jgi:YesN/AraC family two-component response regulator
MTDNLSVLVVDDSDDLRELISMVIERHPRGWHVVATAAEGEQAVVEARSSQPDLVLLDIAMPIMDGMQALPLIREAAPEATVVMLSGYPFETAGPGALDAGAHGYLEKSDLVRSLIPRLENIIDHGAADGTDADPTGPAAG